MAEPVPFERPIIAKLLELGAVRCSKCPGVRHRVGDCEICGYGPAPGRRYPLPTNRAEEDAALERLLGDLRRERMGGY